MSTEKFPPNETIEKKEKGVLLDSDEVADVTAISKKEVANINAAPAPKVIEEVDSEPTPEPSEDFTAEVEEVDTAQETEPVSEYVARAQQVMSEIDDMTREDRPIEDGILTRSEVAEARQVYDAITAEGVSELEQRKLLVWLESFAQTRKENLFAEEHALREANELFTAVRQSESGDTETMRAMHEQFMDTVWNKKPGKDSSIVERAEWQGAVLLDLQKLRDLKDSLLTSAGASPEAVSESEVSDEIAPQEQAETVQQSTESPSFPTSLESDYSDASYNSDWSTADDVSTPMTKLSKAADEGYRWGNVGGPQIREDDRTHEEKLRKKQKRRPGFFARLFGG